MTDVKMDYTLVPTGFRRLKDAEAYSVRFEKNRGWAVLFLHEETGMVSIQSDYGDWAYAWPNPGRGDCTLREFLISCSEDYLAEKFMGRDERRLFDFERTVEAFKETILESRRELNLEKDQARGLFNDIVEMKETESEDLFWERLSADLHDFIDGDYYGYAAHKPEPSYLWLRDGILPALIAELKHLPTAPHAETAA